jgi:hypothetical protein
VIVGESEGFVTDALAVGEAVGEPAGVVATVVLVPCPATGDVIAIAVVAWEPGIG